MDWFTAVMGVAAIGFKAYGTAKGVSNAKDTANQLNPLFAQQAATSQDVAAHEQQINALHQQYMELTNRRSQLENARHAQVARASAEAGGVASGRSLSDSGYFGGQAQLSGEERTNALGLEQGLEIGRGIFAQNNLISGDKMMLAGIGGQINQIEATSKAKAAEAQGWSDLGSSLGNALPIIGKFSQTYDPQSAGRPRVGPFG